MGTIGDVSSSLRVTVTTLGETHQTVGRSRAGAPRRWGGERGWGAHSPQFHCVMESPNGMILRGCAPPTCCGDRAATSTAKQSNIPAEAEVVKWC